MSTIEKLKPLLKDTQNTNLVTGIIQNQVNCNNIIAIIVLLREQNCLEWLKSNPETETQVLNVLHTGVQGDLKKNNLHSYSSADWFRISLTNIFGTPENVNAATEHYIDYIRNVSNSFLKDND